jgi:sulfite exporter TauE/SafE
MILTLATGIVAGAFHVLSGPDHLAAVAPLAISSNGRAWRQGWTWGLGHTSGVVVVALLALALREVLPPASAISSWSERIVGGALVAVGLWSVSRALRIGHAPHAHGGRTHDHTHVQRGPAWARRVGHPHASFTLGLLHGAAGSSHVLGVIPALALQSTAEALLYLAAFGGGSIAAMIAFAMLVGGLRSWGDRGLERALMGTCGVLALAVGATWLWQ